MLNLKLVSKVVSVRIPIIYRIVTTFSRLPGMLCKIANHQQTLNFHRMRTSLLTRLHDLSMGSDVSVIKQAERSL